ncbi:bifunctional adenosylcobinamide kinase/adenosylcobinamide-phosphate guanylyltransferase, partial [Chloroflexota bacterium]
IGGARSGKSDYAQQMALDLNEAVVFVATAEAGDDEMKKRIEAHRKSRPSTWQTIETTSHIGRRIAISISEGQTVIIDCITLLVNNVFQRHDETTEAEIIESDVMSEINELVYCIEQSSARFIIVTNEVGLGLVPGDRVSRLYRDVLGRANQRLAKCSDEVYLMVAGIPVTVKSAG